MRRALSLFVCFISAALFSLSANANYDAEFGLYERCKTQYKNGSCDSVAFFSKKSVLEKFTTCQLPPDIASTLESTSAGANCTNVKSISKLCADSFQKVVVQQSGSYCARATQQQAAAAAASKPGASAPKPVAGSGTSGGDLVALMGAVGVPLVAAFDKKDKKTPVTANANSEKKEATVLPTTSGTTKTTSTELPAAGVIPDDAKARAERSRSVVAEEQRIKAGQEPSQVGSNNEASGKKDGMTEEQATAEIERQYRANHPEQQSGMNASDAANEKSAAQAKIGGEAAAVKTELGDVATPATNALLEAAKNPDAAAKGVTTSLSSSAAAIDKNLREVALQATNTAGKIQVGMAPFTLTGAALSAISMQITGYVSTAKQACIKTAEAASFLCLEGTSEGMQTAKTVMNVAGPALAAINSAQKSCSTTAKVTRMVGTAMTIAKAACVGTKLACDGSCTIAKSQLTTLATNIHALELDIEGDYGTALVTCSINTLTQSACVAEAVGNQAVSIAIAKQLMVAVNVEATPATVGTSPATALKCKGHMQDILLMAVNIAGTIQAQKGAKACADKLKAGDGPTTVEYCAQPANTASSYCKCQKDNTQLGCSGHIVASTTTSSTTTNDSGSPSDNRLNKGGPSGFASPEVSKEKMQLGPVKSPIMYGTGLGGGNDPSLAKDAATTGKTGGGTAAAGGGAGAASGKTSELGDAEGTEKKKWSFGAFTSGFGGGSSGNGKGAADGTGRLGQKDLNAQRKIASEQFRAEVSEASGRSNWEKVRESYVRKSSSLLGR